MQPDQLLVARCTKHLIVLRTERKGMCSLRLNDARYEFSKNPRSVVAHTGSDAAKLRGTAQAGLTAPLD